MSQQLFSPDLQELMLQTVDYALRKFVAGDYFSLLMQAGYEDGTIRVAIFQLPTLEESSNRAEEFLHEGLSGAQRYVVTFVQNKESETPVLSGWMEEKGMDSVVQIVTFLTIKEIEGQKSLEWPKSVDIVGRPDFKWLA